VPPETDTVTDPLALPKQLTLAITPADADRPAAGWDTVAEDVAEHDFASVTVTV
jgi:hypothetical protein